MEKIVKPFRDKTEIGDGDWRCEYWGKWFTGAALAAAYKATAEYERLLDGATKELLATQEPDGYIGTRKKEHHLQGWDVWGRKYVLFGLLAQYDRTGDKVVLEAARRHADSLLAEIGPGKANIADLGYQQWKGLPPSSALEPIVLLYRRTGEARYLEFANYIVGQWSKPSRLAPSGMRLIEDALAGKRVSQICSAKSYEQMSCYEGLCELYRITGKPEYLEACRKVADSIIRDELFVVGSGSDREVWCDGANKQARPLGDPTETCTAVTWLKLCFQLLRLTGDVQYADQMEICLYNAMLGAMKPDGSWFCRVCPLAGTKGPGPAQHGDIGLNCCVVNVPRALFQIPLWAVMTAKDGPVVNLYGAGSFTMPLPSGRTVRIVQETDYPAGDTIHISLHPAAQEEFLLRLRIPSWSAISSIAVNGTPAGVEVAPGTYAGIRRTWKDGDRVDVKLDMRGRLVKDPGGSKQVAVMRGPIVLAVDRRLQKGDGIQAVSLKQEAFPLDLPPRPAAEHEGMWIVAAVPAISTASGKDADLLMCDYASAGNTWTAASAYRVWLAERIDVSRPLSLDGARWIWHASGKDIPLEETAAGACCFRSELTVPEGAIVRTARAVVTADDRFVLYVNGVRVGNSDGAQVDWQTIETFDLMARIRPGRNVIAVEAENATPGPAGLIAKFVVTPEKGDPIVRVTGPDWKCTAQAGGEWHAAAFDDSNWAKAKVVGDFGCAPWGQVPPSE